MAVQRRFIDLSNAPDWMKGEFFALASEADEARAQIAAAEARARQASKKTMIGAFVVAILSGLIGYWRGRRAGAARVAVRSPQ